MLSQDVRDALQAELDHLTIRRKKITERIDERIAALEAVLAPADDLLGETQQLRLKDVPAPSNGNGNGEMSFRDHLRAVLAEHPNLTAPEVALEVIRRGVRPGGETPIGTRVANELFRMAQRGQIDKRNKRYSLLHPA
jgi:hypothetical protein